MAEGYRDLRITKAAAPIFHVVSAWSSSSWYFLTWSLATRFDQVAIPGRTCPAFAESLCRDSAGLPTIPGYFGIFPVSNKYIVFRSNHTNDMVISALINK